MSIGKIASVAVNQAAQSAGQNGKPKFGDTFKQVAKPAQKLNDQHAAGVGRQNVAAPQQTKAVASSKVATADMKSVQAGKVVDQVTQAQARLDKILALAQSGKSFTPAELLALQAQVASASQQLDLAGKVVEKATGGIKQVLQTQL